MLVFMILGIGIVTKALMSYDLGTIGAPGPGFFPLAVGLLITVISAISWIGSLKTSTSKNSAPSESPQAELGGHRKELVGSIAIMAIYAFSLDGAGFFISSGIMLFLFFYWVGKVPLLRSIAGAFGTAAICYFLFAKLLEVQIPKGIIPF